MLFFFPLTAWHFGGRLLVNGFLLIIFSFPLSLSHRSCSVRRYGFPFTSCVRFFLHSHFPNSLSFTASSASHNWNHLAFLLPLTHWLLVSQPPPAQVLYLYSTSSSLSLLTSSVSHLSGQKLHLILSRISSSWISPFSQSTFTPDMQSFPLPMWGMCFEGGR